MVYIKREEVAVILAVRSTERADVVRKWRRGRERKMKRGKTWEMGLGNGNRDGDW